MSQPPDTWASEMQALQDQIEVLQLDLECARRNEAAATYWYGQDDGVRGACLRWQEALTEPMPKGGTMREPLETLYRQTEAMRRELATAISDIAFLRGQRDGYLYLIHVAVLAIEKHWAPHDPISSGVREGLLDRLGQSTNVAWEGVAAGLSR